MAHFHLSWNEVTKEIPLANLIMLAASIPKIKRTKTPDPEKKPKKHILDIFGGISKKGK